MAGEKRRVEGNPDLEDQGKDSAEEGSRTPALPVGRSAPAIEFGTKKLEPLTALTLPLTKYEKSRIIGARALQISLGAPILVQIPPEAADPISIAEFELKANVLPITIRRKLPGRRFENIPLAKLATEWV